MSGWGIFTKRREEKLVWVHYVPLLHRLLRTSRRREKERNFFKRFNRFAGFFSRKFHPETDTEREEFKEMIFFAARHLQISIRLSFFTPTFLLCFTISFVSALSGLRTHLTEITEGTEGTF